MVGFLAAQFLHKSGSLGKSKKTRLAPQTVFRFAASRTTYVETAAAANEIQTMNLAHCRHCKRRQNRGEAIWVRLSSPKSFPPQSAGGSVPSGALWTDPTCRLADVGDHTEAALEARIFLPACRQAGVTARVGSLGRSRASPAANVISIVILRSVATKDLLCKASSFCFQ